MFKTKHEKRTDIVKMITELRDRGATFNEVVKKLNTDKVLTIRGGLWTIPSVHRFYYMHK